MTQQPSYYKLNKYIWDYVILISLKCIDRLKLECRCFILRLQDPKKHSCVRLFSFLNTEFHNASVSQSVDFLK